jgi:rhamnopyranosyl-N-acetylglucosaminyl-diphospho-decaprenol beta-1,3/1,4-galactofuranosyltransferase
MYKIAAIVVTYNRKECLETCLGVIRGQTLIPDVIYVIDNHSTDGTATYLSEQQYITEIPDPNHAEDITITSTISSLDTTIAQNILFKYIYKSANTGGAGGFYTGMKAAYDDGYEWLWMMDDDGVPLENGLEQLFLNTLKYGLHFSNALVVDIKNHSALSFGLEVGKKSVNDYKDLDVVWGLVNPFNGSLINRKVLQDIGFVKKEMFIWGDEYEYILRVAKNKFSIGTIVKSIHYHPKAVAEYANVIPYCKKYIVKRIPQNRIFIFFRNLGYCEYTYNRRNFYVIFLLYLSYYLSRLKFASCITFMRVYIKGSKNQF